uniref:PhoH-like protein n=1 Tax=viral metagenome TaxID=1070528 RepID=A0A6C0JNM9_9ZZZZ
MYFKIFVPVMFLFSRTLSYQSLQMHRINKNNLIMRLKKTASTDNYPSDWTKSSRRIKKSLVPAYKPRSENQKTYVSHLANDSVPIVFGIGPAGCGKTLFACVRAIDGLRSGDFQKIVLTRPVVPVEEEELGFLPGNLVKKMDPWTRPLMDIFLEYYPPHELDFMISSGVIEISPLAYMRGRTFKRCFIIADEMQNSSPGQMLMLTTRIGDGSKMVITGDLKQSDRSMENGLLDFMNKIRDYRGRGGEHDIGIELVEMNKGDIERSPIVSKILEIFSSNSNYNSNNIGGQPNITAYPGIVTNFVENKIMQVERTNITNIKIKRPQAPNNNDAALIPLSTAPRTYNRDLFY